MATTKITKSQYDALKESYLAKNRTMYSLYVELNNEIEVSKHLFFQLINKIRREEGLNHYYK
ncbi:hypothetical protein [Methanobrevibacter sp.]|uniref:hypothetical protein n=1 Tax=Methanobrevibacter sp. TaxID=66852 RepID=UPI0038692975